MLQRTLTTVVGVPIALAIVAWPSGLPATLACAMVLSLAYAEYCAMCNAAGIPCRLWWGAAGIVVLVYAAQLFSPPPTWLPEAAMVLVWLVVIMETGRPDRQPVLALGSTLLGAAWIGGLGSSLTRLRFLQPVNGVRTLGIDSGAWIVTGVLVIVWVMDTSAYLVGKSLGRTPLAPTISPKKTVEGGVAAFFAAALAGILCAPLMSLSTRDGLVLGAAIGVAGQVGDLFESAIKRELKCKDSGSALPGHGGWLDRIDSLLFASAIAAWWLSQVFG